MKSIISVTKLARGISRVPMSTTIVRQSGSAVGRVSNITSSGLRKCGSVTASHSIRQAMNAKFTEEQIDGISRHLQLINEGICTVQSGKDLYDSFHRNNEQEISATEYYQEDMNCESDDKNRCGSYNEGYFAGILDAIERMTKKENTNDKMSEEE